MVHPGDFNPCPQLSNHIPSPLSYNYSARLILTDYSMTKDTPLLYNNVKRTTFALFIRNGQCKFK